MSASVPPRPVLSYAEVTEIVELIRSASAFTEFRLRSGDLELEVRRGSPAASPAQGGHAASPAPAKEAATEAAAPSTTSAATAPMAKATALASGASAVPTARSERAVLVKSPMVGTFYRAPEPGAAPFVQPGQAVKADTTVCIIEVMKLMNTLPAGCEGFVSEILVGDGEAVEYGQVLVVIEPR